MLTNNDENSELFIIFILQDNDFKKQEILPQLHYHLDLSAILYCTQSDASWTCHIFQQFLYIMSMLQF
jgi:hypothetical protein